MSRLAALAMSILPLAALTAHTAGAQGIVPHRAIYELRLAGADPSGTLADVRGLMSFEWTDACDGWAVSQRYQIEYVYAEGPTLESTTSFVTWEAKDGQSYRFNASRATNGVVEEEFKGEAILTVEGGEARYVLPEAKTVDLPAGAMFPTRHTLELIEHAQAGDPFFPAIVFDGSDAEGLTRMGAAIGPAKPAAAPSDDDAAKGEVALLKGPSWPINLAFFDPDPIEALPNYEMSFSQLANGVGRDIRIDYGDFALKGVLRRIESTPAPAC